MPEKIKLTCLITKAADEALRSICFHEKMSMSDVVDQALCQYVAQKEKNLGIRYPRRGELRKGTRRKNGRREVDHLQ